MGPLLRAVASVVVLLLAAGSVTGIAQTMIIANKGENTASFIDLETGKEWARQPTGPLPHEASISPNGRVAAVNSYGGSTIDLFNVRTAKRFPGHFSVAINTLGDAFTPTQLGDAVLAAQSVEHDADLVFS